MKLKELLSGCDFVSSSNAKKGSLIMRVKSHLKSGETKVSILKHGTICYLISNTEVVIVPKERDDLFNYNPTETA